MLRSNLKGQRLVVLFLVGGLLFNYPLLAVFNGAGEAFGIPALYVYIFVSWALMIGLLAIVVERSH